MDGDDEEVVPDGRLPPELEVQRTCMIVGPEMNYHVNTVTSAMTYMSVGYDNSWDHDDWAMEFQTKVISLTTEKAVFELINVDPSIVNSLRRILLSEVPSVAIENVFVIDYDCVIPEEVLSHRLGLVPLTIDANMLEWKEEKADQSNTVVWKLAVECGKKPDGTVRNDKVYSSDLEWLPGGSEYPAETGVTFTAEQPESLDAKPIDSNILLARLRPGQRIELEAHAVKGIGADHAKFSPVGTAWHRLYPEIAVLKDVPEDIARQLAEEVPQIFSLRQPSKANASRLAVTKIRDNEKYEAKVKDTVTQDRYKDYVQLRKRKEHHIFTVESANGVPAGDLFVQALKILRDKSQHLRDML